MGGGGPTGSAIGTIVGSDPSPRVTKTCCFGASVT
jgi:hypothetical protein